MKSIYMNCVKYVGRPQLGKETSLKIQGTREHSLIFHDF